MIPLFKVPVTTAVLDSLKAVIESGYIGQGKKCEEFERALIPWVGSPNLALVNHGTSAIRLALRLSGVGPGDEVVSPPMTCLHYTSAVLLPDRSVLRIGNVVNQKIKTEVLSVNPNTLQLEPKKIVGWVKAPVTEKWYRIRCKSKRGSRGPGGKWGIFVTGDHQVLTECGYKRVDQLASGDKIATSQRSFNPRQLEVINGMLLGDGHIARIHKGGTRFSCAHAQSQEEWFNLGLSALKGFDVSVRNNPAKPGHQASLLMETKRGLQWSSLREKWYSQSTGSRVVPPDVPLTPITLATWYMDDGSLVKDSAILCTDRYSTESLWILFWKIAELGLKPQMFKVGGGRGGYRISISNGNYNGTNGHNSAEKFFSLIAPYIPPSMRYKLPAELDLLPFDQNLWSLGDSEMLFDEVEVEEISHPDGKNSWAYCIEVEDNHNFISGDMVFKNCSATNTPILEQFAIPVWADIDPWTGNIDPTDVERKLTPKTKAIIAVHWGGYPCEIDQLLAISKKYGIPLIQDCAHAFGAVYRGRELSSYGSFGAYSFQAIKLLSTVEGGLLVCPSVGDYRRAKLLRWYGIDRETPRADLRTDEDIVEAGYKYNSTDVAAAIGLEQLKGLKGLLHTVRENAAFYRSKFFELRRVHLLEYKADRLSSYWLFTIRVDDRESFQEWMKSKEIMVSRVHVRNDAYTAFAPYRRNLPGVDEFSEYQVSIPVGWWVTPEDREKIANAVLEWNDR